MFKLLVIFVIIAVVWAEANQQPQRQPNHSNVNARRSHQQARAAAARHPTVRNAPARRPAVRNAPRTALRNPRVDSRNARRPVRRPARRPAANNRQRPKNRRPARPITHGRPRGTGGLKLRVNPRKRADANKTCLDKAANCKDFIAFCTDKDFTSILKQYCASGCGFCAPEGDDCKDKFSTCAQWNAKGFCKSSGFMTAQGKRSMCPKTCGLCGTTPKPPVDCNKTKYDAKCLATTCAKAEEKKSDACVKYCADAKNKERPECKTTPVVTPPVAEQCTDSNKYTEKCYEQTCAKPDEKTKTEAKTCKDWCTADANKSKKVCDCKDTANAKAAWCPATTDECTPDDKKYTEACYEKTCAKPEEKTKTEAKTCKDWCGADANKSKKVCDCKDTANAKAAWCPATTDECTPDDKKYTEACYEKTCAKPEEKTDAKSKCKEWCGADANKDKDVCECKKNTANAKATWCSTAADDCEDPAKRYTDACLPKVCDLDLERTNWAPKMCKDACAAKPTLEICKCDAEKNKDGKAAWCPRNKAHDKACAGDEKKADCLKARCKDPGQKFDPECFKTLCEPTAGDAEEACKCDQPGEVNKYLRKCASATNCVAAKEDELKKVRGGCYYHCKMNEAANLPECDCTKVKNSDYCLEKACEKDKKASKECQDWCGRPGNEKRFGCV